MASTMVPPSRALLEALSPIRSRPACDCVKAAQTKRRMILQQRRNISTANAQRSEMEVEGSERPRWSQTPAAMKAPYPIKARPADWQPFKCNSDPQKLDAVYVKILGQNGPKMLSEETKWLAVTHKSFDHGRRGFNERLAFLGKRILELQTSLGLLASMDASQQFKEKFDDPHGRKPFDHPATVNAESLLGNAKSFFMHHKQIARIARQYKLPEVVRWKPKDEGNLTGSGCDVVYAQAVFAIVGALALEQGGAVANQVARERIIQRLGMNKGIEGIPDTLNSS